MSAHELQRRAISGSAWTAATTVISVPVAFVGNAVIARSLGVASYGDLAFLSATLGLAYTLSNFGFSSALIQHASSAEASGGRNEADRMLRRSLGFHMAIELPILLVVVLAITRNDPLWEAIALATAVAASCAFSSASLSITIENRTAAAARLATSVGIAVQAAAVTTALLTHSAPAVWAVRTVIPAVALVFSLFLLDRHRRRIVLRPQLPTSLGPTFWRFALFSWGSGLLALLVYSRSEIFILRAFHQPHALGLFALAFGMSQIITAPADAMLHALLPAVAGILGTWPERARDAFERSSRVSSLASGAVAAVVIPTLLFAVPSIYGSSYRAAAWLFLPLGFISCFQSLNNPVLAFVNGRQRGGLIFRATAVGLGLDLALALALIPTFGAWGAVAANVGGQLLSLTLLVIAEPLAGAHSLVALIYSYRAFGLGIASAGVAILLGALLWHGAPAIAASCAVGGGLYLVSVRATRSGLTSEDRDAVVGALATRGQLRLARLLAPLTNPSTA